MIAPRPAIDDVRWQRVVDLLDLYRHLERDPDRGRLVWYALARLLKRMCAEDDRRGVRESVPTPHGIRSYDWYERHGFVGERF